MTFYAFPDFPPVLAYIAWVREEEIARAVEYVESVPPVANQGQSAAPTANAAPGAVTGGGGHSDAWWAAIAQCESGTQNGWRTGYFGLEGRPGISSLSYAEQLAVARGIYSWAGPGAWGCSPVADANVPGG